MRYFRYKKTSKVWETVMKLRYESLAEEEKKRAKKQKIFNTIAIVVLFTAMILCFAGCVFAITAIPSPENGFLKILWLVGICVLVFVALIFSGVIGFFVSVPFWSKDKNDYYTTPSTREQLSKACAHLREYYGFCEPCLTTKCYYSSNENFIDRDVCIFVAGDELRITVDLQSGFADGEKDAGCYAFKAEEITLKKEQGERFLIAEIRCCDTVFSLGYRAKGFIQRNFLC